MGGSFACFASMGAGINSIYGAISKKNIREEKMKPANPGIKISILPLSFYNRS